MASRTYSPHHIGKDILLCSSPGLQLNSVSQWQTLIAHQGPYDTCKGVQLVVTALLGQVYGVLSRVCRTNQYCGTISYQPLIERGHPCHKSSIPHVRLLLGETLRNGRQ